MASALPSPADLAARSTASDSTTRAGWRSGSNSTDGDDPFKRRGTQPGRATLLRVGCEGFDDAFKLACDGIYYWFDTDPNPGLQHTRALVLKCSSGVGKTFLTFTLRAKSKAQGRDVFSSYLGFSCGWQLSERETLFLKSAAAEAKENTLNAAARKMQHLLLRRLLLSLTGLRDKCLSGGTPSLANLDGPGTHVQFMPFYPEEVKPSPEEDDMTVCDVKTRILKVLHEFPVADGRRLVVAVAIDEGQWLDEFDSRFARLALKCLRQLQCDVLKKTGHRILLMPIMTGINPVTVVFDRTEGFNETLSRERVMMSRTEFAQLADMVSPGTKHVKHIADLLYPRVRAMIEFLQFNTLTRSTVNDNVVMDASLLLIAALSCSSLCESEVDTTSIAVQYEPDGGVRVVLDLTVWESLVRLHRAKYRRVPDAAFRLPAMSSAILEKSSTDCFDFEAQAFDVVRLFLGIFGPVREALEGCIHYVVSDWLPPMNFWLMCTETLAHPSQHLHPFASHHSHEVAVAGPLSREFVRAVTTIATWAMNLRTPCALWVRCLGSAAIGFILVVCWPTPGGLVGTARFMNAKQKTAQSTLKSLESTLEEVTRKAQDTHAGLTRELRGGHTAVTLDDFNENHVALVTNCDDEGVVDRVFSRGTFHWAPWTLTLFSESESDPTS